jgi:hypothetical protein
MQHPLVAFLLCLNGVLCALPGLGRKPSDTSKSDISSLTPSNKMSNALRDILNQESLVRFSMTQQIQALVTDALANKNLTWDLKRKLINITSELESNAAKYQVMKQENDDFRLQMQMINNTVQNLSLQLQPGKCILFYSV